MTALEKGSSVNEEECLLNCRSKFASFSEYFSLINV